MEKEEGVFALYRDIQERCKGEIYMGVVGPVRTGKSTFIKHFLEELVLPVVSDEHVRERTRDEMPLSGQGTMITTTQPQFIPAEGMEIELTQGIRSKIRLIDCVGYMVEGASGHMDGENQRMVSTPWFEQKIPFSEAAKVGTDKVIKEHATIGIVMTTDGTITEIPRQSYVSAERKTIETLQSIGKPFVIVVNSEKPYSADCQKLVEKLSAEYGVGTIAVNCEQLKKEDIHQILKMALFEFPISSIEMMIPAWMETMATDHPMMADLIQNAKVLAEAYHTLKDVIHHPIHLESEYLQNTYMESMDLSNGLVRLILTPKEKYYYEILSDSMGERIENEYDLLSKLKDYGSRKNEYEQIAYALEQVRNTGYGVVTPLKEEIAIEEPSLIHNGNKYGVKIKAVSPSIHLIKANIETEIAPIVGEKNQAEDLIRYIEESRDLEDGIWNTTIFGKSVEQMVVDGIDAKTAQIGVECQKQLQDTMQKIVNDKNGGMVCIIL